MDLRDQIGVYLNTAWKKQRADTPYAGHSLVKFAEWTRESGFVKKDKAAYTQGSVDIAIPCPVIAIVDTIIRKESLELTITGKTVDVDGTESFDQLGTTITKNKYKAGTTTVQTTLSIPRFTRPTATFLLSGLGNQVFEITNITQNVDLSAYGGGKVSFYGLASEGSKILYYLGMLQMHNSIKQVVNSIWVHPPTCPICNGVGRVDDGARQCPECDGYKYMGENAIKGIALNKGYDVRISRDKFSSYPITDAQWQIVWKFINKAWTQKWWVTPTISEIKRMFAHFYNVAEGEIIITERYHFSMPHWDISLPLEGSVSSPFGQGDTDLMRFIAESVTPAGVNVFVGFYNITQMGGLDDLQCACIAYGLGHHGVIEAGDIEGISCLPILAGNLQSVDAGDTDELEQEFDGIISDAPVLSMKVWESSIEQDYGLWNGRWRVWNGWCECVDNFEGDLSKWNTSGTIDLFNVNDIGRNWARLWDGSYMETLTGFAVSNATGTVDIWIHPHSTDLRIGGYLTGVEQWAFYVDFRNSGFYDHNNNLIRSANFDNDFHLSISFVTDQILTGTLGYINEIEVNRNSIASGIAFLSAMAPGRPIRIQSSGVGFSNVDNFGGDWVPGYTAGDNWARLYPWGWGQNHVDCLSGVSNLYKDIFRTNKFFNASGVC